MLFNKLMIITTLFVLAIFPTHNKPYQNSKQFSSRGKDRKRITPANNDYSNPKSDCSFKPMVEDDNMVLVWHKEFVDPTTNANERKPDSSMVRQ